jgi:hypothetical protein
MNAYSSEIKRTVCWITKPDKIKALLNMNTRADVNGFNQSGNLQRGVAMK